MKVPIDRIPPLAAWTEDVSGAERRFVPFIGGSAPQPDQAAVRAMNAAAAREAVEITGEYARVAALPLALLVSCGVGAGMFLLVERSSEYWALEIAASIAFTAGALAYAVLRQRLVWRHRGYAARTALMTLGRCLEALKWNCDHPHAQPHIVPFRQSKLTRIFQQWFVAQSRMVMLVNVSAAAADYDEMVHALRYAHPHP